MIKSIIYASFSLAVAIIVDIDTTIAASSSPLSSSHYLQSSPVIQNHIHQNIVHRTLNLHTTTTHHQNNIDNNQQQQYERFTATDESCPGTPFLWKINNIETGKHVGFGVGTMHLPKDVVLTQGSYDSILAAIADSCEVYGELNTFESNVISELTECATGLVENAPTLLDIPDEELRSEIKAKLLEIVSTFIETEIPEAAEVIANRLDGLPLTENMNMILYANTPEYMANHSQTIYSGVGAPSLDNSMLALGRPADDIEDAATQCEALQAMYPSKEEFQAAYDATPDLYAQEIRNSLTASLSKNIELYKCGNIDEFIAANEDGTLAVDEFTGNNILTTRNVNMAARINEALNANPNERVLFAVGALHWVIGDSSLENLLKDYGYSLEHVPEWKEGSTENHSNEHCDVMFNPVTGLFVTDPDDDSPGAAPSGFDSDSGITMEPTHTVILTPADDLEEDVPSTTTPAADVSGVEQEVPAPTPSSSGTTIGTSTILFAGFIYLLSCV